jgi:chaperonin GroES
MQILPLQDRVLVKRLEEETKTAGGIIIPDNHAERPAQGEVVAVGPGKTSKDGTLRPLTLKKGDKIIFGKYSGSEVKLDGTEYLIMKEDDVLGVIR